MKRKAFTLTELLVVVVVIGTLAAVVLPKFTKVLETRRTTEAEQLMAAVRNEQEARCTLDKNYTAVKEKLASWPKSLGSSYEYTLGANGMTATRADKDYSLQMPTYFDGGICCSGEYCDKLNKHYPDCATYVAKANKGCAASDIPYDPTPEKCTEGETRLVGEPHCGKQASEICHGGEWESNSDQDVALTAEERETCTCKPKPEITIPCENYGKTGEGITLIYECQDGAWVNTGAEENCEVTGDCSDRNYKLSHKEQCCPGTPVSDTDCWRRGLDGARWRMAAPGVSSYGANLTRFLSDNECQQLQGPVTSQGVLSNACNCAGYRNTECAQRVTAAQGAVLGGKTPETCTPDSGVCLYEQVYCGVKNSYSGCDCSRVLTQTYAMCVGPYEANGWEYNDGAPAWWTSDEGLSGAINP